MMFRRLSPALIAVVSLIGLPAARGQTVDFNRDIRPILSDACFHCHGPDKSKRKAKLHLDTADGAGAVLVAGKPEESELVKRITAKDPAKRMPPVASGHSLNQEQIELLRAWVAQGGKYDKHWSFIAPRRAPLPNVKNKEWCRNPIDRFILAGLEKEGLPPSPEASRTTLIRRVTLDLTGLPPMPAEVDAFLADKSSDAYEKLVDRLLASPRYGERMAKPWLDAARYADTNGYQTDGDRIMWRWRDWVINAFNANMPFDRFTIEQIAGDMLPGATLEQQIATGFNRNHRGNSEGGVIPEEYAVEYVVDRVDTTSTVWLGLTAGCAKCHSHKYDPVSQKEFYQLFAFFNNVPEHGKAIKYGNSRPYIKSPTRAQEVEWKLLKSQLHATDIMFAGLQTELNRHLDDWSKQVPSEPVIDWNYDRGLLTHVPFDVVELPAATEGARATLDVALIRSILRGEVRFGPGKIGNAIFLEGTGSIKAGDVGHFGFFDKFTIAAWIKPEAKGGAIVSRMPDTDRAEGYNFAVVGGKLHVHLIKRWLDDAIRVETVDALTPGRWHHVAFSYDGSRLASGVKVFLDGLQVELKVNLDDLNQSFKTDEPFRIGAGGGQESRFHGGIDDLRIYDHVLLPSDAAMLANTDSITAIARKAGKLTLVELHKLRSYYLQREAPSRIREVYQRLLAAGIELEQFEESLPTTMVMEEMPTPRDTHLLLRGEYDKKGPKVSPGLPAALPPLPSGAPNSRLGFAKWLIDKSNPLTARVTVNRFWQMLFGTGIVKTVEDFGAQGEWPSHPELLDWLAVEFMDPIWGVGENCCAQGSWDDVQSWDVKHLLKTIVTSATYRQSSKATRDLLHKDPDNRLLARGPRVRLPAEMIRDQALYVSGLLVERIGGPSVRPYQPAGLAKELHGTDDYEQDHAPNLYRRSLYTFWKRTVAPPTLMTFDAANRETCVVRESRTNTPLQALNLMNDVTFVEAARVLAERVLSNGTAETANLTQMFRLATGRQPTDRELSVLRANLNHHRQHFRQEKNHALQLVRSGEHPRNANLDVVEVAAYAAIANLILNLDEVVTKE